MPQMIIANSLANGVVVFRARSGGWSPAIAEGAVIEDPQEAERLFAAAKDDELRNLVIDPSLIEVEVENGNPKPTAIREAIRAFGPTVRTDLTEVGRRGDAA